MTFITNQSHNRFNDKRMQETNLCFGFFIAICWQYLYIYIYMYVYTHIYIYKYSIYIYIYIYIYGVKF